MKIQIFEGMSIAAFVAILTGSATPPSPPLYQWDADQPQVYEHLKGKTSPKQQIDALEKGLQQISAKGKPPPPRFHAQLGMLYASVGKDQQAQQELLAENRLFPESTAYVDFLLKRNGQQ